MNSVILQGLSGALTFAVIFYVAGSILMRRWITVDIYQLLLCMAATFLVAIVGEVYLGKLYALFAGKPLWQYRVWPIHDGYTSALNFIIWPFYGYYIYFLHHVLREKKIIIRPSWLQGVAAGVDGPILEILANGFFLLFYGTFYFYYFPGELRHYTSIQVIPLYMVMGVILSLILGFLENKPRRWHYPAGLYMGGIGFVLTG